MFDPNNHLIALQFVNHLNARLQAEVQTESRDYDEAIPEWRIIPLLRIGRLLIAIERHAIAPNERPELRAGRAEV